MPHQHPTGGQGPAPSVSQSTDGITDAARWYMGLSAEAQAGAPPAAANGAGGGDQGASEDGATADGSGGGFNWDLFPNVPEEQRSLLEPHLKNVQGHVTQLQQQYAPYKSIIDAGLDGETVQSLVAFNQQFSQDPIGTWLELAVNMQKAGTLSGDLDLEAVKAILEGKDPDEGEVPAGGEEGEEIPAWARRLEERLDAQDEEAKTQKEQETQQQRAGELKAAMDNMRTQLKEAGYPEDAITDEILRAALIANQGDADKALQQLTGLRESVLKGFTEKQGNGGGGSDLEMPNGSPKPPARESRGPNREFAEARKGARQMLERQARDDAQS